MIHEMKTVELQALTGRVPAALQALVVGNPWVRVSSNPGY